MSSTPFKNNKVPTDNQFKGQKDYLRNVPDFFVTINNKLTVGTSEDDGFIIDISDRVKSIEISNNIESPPASCDINIALPLHISESRTYDFSQKYFREMDEIHVYFKNYFRYSDTKEYGYSLVFFGLITRKSTTKTSNSFELTLNCQDMLWWWSRMKFNTNPALIDRSHLDKGSELGVYQTIYGDKTPFEIIYFISKGFELDTLSSITQLGRTNAGADSLLNGEIYKRWQVRFEDISNRIQIMGLTGVEYNPNFNSDHELQSKSSAFLKSTNTSYPNASVPKINIDTEDTLSSTKLLLDEAFLENVKPFRQIQIPSNFNSEFKSRLEIATETARLIGFEFFQDMDGYIKFKPPLYNMYVNVNENPIYVIRNLSLSNASFSSDVSEIITEISASGKFDDQAQDNNDINDSIFALYRDVHLASIYGIQDNHITLSWARTSEQCLLFAIGELDRYNARRFTASITIPGRPELKLGMPIFIESTNEFYYLRGLNHSFDVESASFTTTLELDSKRSKFYNPKTKLAESLAYAEIDVGIPEGSSVLPTIVGSGTLNYGTGRIYSNVEIGNGKVYKQISDNLGYEIIGSFSYGRGLMVMQDGTIKIRPKTPIQEQNKISAVVNSLKSTEMYIKRQVNNSVEFSDEMFDNSPKDFLQKLSDITSSLSLKGVLDGSLFQSFSGIGQSIKNLIVSDSIKDVGKNYLKDKVSKNVNTSNPNSLLSKIKKKFKF